MQTTSPSLILNKQPILKHDKSLFGYQLSVDILTAGLTDEAIAEFDFLPQLNSLYTDIETSGGIGLLTQNKPVFFKIDAHLLNADALPTASAEGSAYKNLIIEVDNHILGNTSALTELKKIAQNDIKVAINLTDMAKDIKLLSLAHYVKVSAQQFDPIALEAHLEELSEKEVILSDVDTDEKLDRYAGLNIAYFQGFFFTEPVITTHQEPEANRLAILKLLAEVNDPDIEFDQIVSTVQVDTLLSHKLISAINHPQNDLPTYVDNLKDAVTYMGLKRLKFWVNLLVMSQIDDVPKELLVTALIRAKFLEMLATSSGYEVDKDRFFMVGLFSTLNAFLKISMIDIADKLPIQAEIKSALVDQTGNMGKALFIVKSLEQGNTQIISMGYESLGIMEVSSDYMKANGWAYQTLASLNA